MKNDSSLIMNIRKEVFCDLTNIVVSNPAVLGNADSIERLVMGIASKIISKQNNEPKRPPSQSLRPHTNPSKKSLIPKSISTYEPEEVVSRKIFDLKRWHCMSRPQYSKSCGISCLTSCYNFLYSTLGHGSKPIASQEAMCALFGYKGNINDIKFDQFSNNSTIIQCFTDICKHFKINGKASMLYKPQGELSTPYISEKTALQRLMDGLRNNKKAFMYHCWGHYLMIVGYEIIPKKEVHAYSGTQDIGDESEVWLLIADTNRDESPIISRRWADIVKDLVMKFPAYIDIRHLERGEMQIQNFDGSGNPHGILVLETGL